MSSPPSTSSCSRKNASIAVTSASSIPRRSGGGDDPPVARADVGAPRLLAMAEAAHRVDPAADPFLRLHHLHARAVGFEVERGGKPGEPGADDDDIAPVPGRGQGSALPARPHDETAGAGRKGMAAQGGLRRSRAAGGTAIGGGRSRGSAPRVPRAARTGSPVMRSRARGRGFMPTNAGWVPTVAARTKLSPSSSARSFASTSEGRAPPPGGRRRSRWARPPRPSCPVPAPPRGRRGCPGRAIRRGRSVRSGSGRRAGGGPGGGGRARPPPRPPASYELADVRRAAGRELREAVGGEEDRRIATSLLGDGGKGLLDPSGDGGDESRGGCSRTGAGL